MRKLYTILSILFLSTGALNAQSPGNSLHFDGSNDYTTHALPSVFNNIAANDFTIETWIKPMGSATSRVMFAQLNSNSFVSILLNTSNVPYLYVYNGNANGLNTTNALPLNQWTHLACTWEAATGTISIYFDGVLQTTGAGGSSSLSTDGTFAIGGKSNGSQLFQGELDEFRIWDVARTECQIQSAMVSDFTSLPTNCVAYYNCNQGTAAGNNAGITTITDMSTNYDGTLNGFNLSGASSNWLASGATITTSDVSGTVVTSTDTRTECDSLEWIDGTTYYANNSTATHMLSTVSGCDSLVTLDLTIVSSTSSTDIISSCNPIVWLDGNTYSSSNNSATHIISNAQGCDSIISLDFTLNAVDTGVSLSGFTIMANASSGYTYQWVDCDNGFAPISGETSQSFTATSNGNYAVVLNNGVCTDTSACTLIAGIGIDENAAASIKLYPNPTTGLVSIEYDSKLKNIEILDVNGRLIKQISVQGQGVSNIVLPDVKGTYLVKSIARNGVISYHKLIRL